MPSAGDMYTTEERLHFSGGDESTDYRTSEDSIDRTDEEGISYVPIAPPMKGSSPVLIPFAVKEEREDEIDNMVMAVQNVSLNDGCCDLQCSDDDRDLNEEDHVEVFGEMEQDLQNSDHWARLRENFMNSSWFRKVDQILSETLLLNSLVRTVGRPAEVFYNTAMDAYLSTNKFSDFMDVLKQRLGTAWDDRLTHPATVFFTTARAASTMLGAGRFVGGAIQLGRSTLNSAINSVILRWERILGVTDYAVDMLLPEFSEDIPEEVPEDEYSSYVDQKEDVLIDDDGVCGGEENSDSSMKKRRRGVVDIATKVSRRVRQRIPSLEAIGLHVKSRLQESFWFQKVDEILLQNVLVKSMGDLVRPAEHFYETAMNTFSEQKRSLDDFLSALKSRLGAAWDDRLMGPACEFYESATEASESDLSGMEMQRRIHSTKKNKNSKRRS